MARWNKGAPHRLVMDGRHVFPEVRALCIIKK
jgi:hypothetical protein